MSKDEKEHLLKIIGSNYEFSTHANFEYLNENLEKILEFINKLEESLGVEQLDVDTPTEKEISEVPEEDIPAIKASSSTTENIRLLYRSEWGKTPRSIAEVMKALEINAVPDKVTSINTYLVRLVKQGFLRRIKKEGLYHYYKLPDTE